ncbi:MAG: tetratricopeptide repeat protein [Candidatus Omnitrophota bacterium]
MPANPNQDMQGTVEKIKIFLASSSELKEEREKFVEIIHRLNKSHDHLFLDVDKWETDMEKGTCNSERFQDEINYRIDDCPIVVVLFCSKVGTFTFEEYKSAREKEKKIFVYFKDFTPKNKDEHKSLGDVFELQDLLEKEEQILLNRFTNLDQFDTLVSHDLNLHISRKYQKKTLKKNVHSKATELEAYLAKIEIISVNQNASTSGLIFNQTSEDLDGDQLKNFFQLERVIEALKGSEFESIEKRLGYLHLMEDDKYFKKGAYLSLGKRIQRICPDASPLNFFVFQDIKGLKPFIAEMVDGNLVTQYHKTISHLKANMYLTRDIYTDRKEDYEIPEVVFRELLANALIHREYTNSDIVSYIQVELYPDRLEIKNPGLFSNQVHIETIDTINKSYLRNKEIALIFFLNKFVERAGTGIRRIQEILKENGLKPAVFSENKKGNYVSVTVYKKEKFQTDLTGLKKEQTKLLTILPSRKINLIGREKDLASLEDALKTSKRVILVNGLGGIGKTEVCKAFFINHYQDYRYAAWVDWVSSVKESIVNALGHDNSIFIQANETDTPTIRFEKIRERLLHIQESFLLVMDNIENPEDPDLGVLASLPSGVKILTNSRSNIEGYENLSLDFLSPSDCKTLFYEFYKGKKKDDLVEKILALCGYHTLTVELLAKTAYHAIMSIEDLYKMLESKGFNLSREREEKVSTFWHDEKERKTFLDHLVKVFDVSDVTENELSILVNLSILPSVYLPVQWVTEWLMLRDNAEIVSLINKGWLRRDEESRILIHPVIQEVVKYKTKPDLNQCRELIESLGWKLHLEPGDNPIQKKEYLIYGESIIRTMNVEQRDENLATLANNLSAIYKYIGQLDRALEFQLKALDIRKVLLDSQHPDLATSYNNISLIYSDLDQLDRALEFQSKALSIFEEVLDNQHPLLASSYNNISTIYKNLGQLDRALEFQLKALDIRKALFDPQHPDLAMSYNNISMIYQDMGQLDRALEFQLKAIDILEAVLDRQHPSLATLYNNISMIYQGMGKLDDALLFAEKAVTILQTLFPDGHPNLDIMKKNLDSIKKEKK